MVREWRFVAIISIQPTLDSGQAARREHLGNDAESAPSNYLSVITESASHSGLCLRDSLVRTSSLASTTVDANVSVDGVNITLLDCLNWAFADTRTASYALASVNYTCHNRIK